MPKINATTYKADWTGPYVPNGLPNGPQFYQQMQVFLPPGPPPAKGWPFHVYWVYGNFALSALPGGALISKPADGGSFALWYPWLALEQRVCAMVRCSLVGTNSRDYAPGGSLYEGGSGQFDLPAEVPGRGSADPYGETAADLNHHPAPGQPDPGLEFQSPNRAASYVPQKCRELAAQGVLPLNPELSAASGRSSGAQPTAWLMWGPDEADPSATDHRQYDSRVSCGIIGAPYAWWPMQQNFIGNGSSNYFPKTSDPVNQLCSFASDAPFNHRRELSMLRFATRDWSHVGGPTGAVHRAVNGAKPCYIRVTDDDWALSGSVTNALAFDGTDSNDNRVPSAQNVIGSVPHPAIMGPLMIARLFEIQPYGGFSNDFHRCYMRQENVDKLVGETAPELGVPAEALVSGTKEELESGDPITMGGQDIVDWLRSVWDELDPAWASLPEETVQPAIVGRDVVLLPSRRGDVRIGQVDLERDPGMAASVITSLFSDRRLPADQQLPSGESDRRGVWFDTEADRWGSLLWTLAREKRTRDVLVRAEGYVREALEWLVEDGVAESVTARAEYEGERMTVQVEVLRGESRAWSELWRESSAAAYAVDNLELAITFVE